MVPTCSACNCNSKPGEGYSFHKFPEDHIICALWLYALGRANFSPTIYSRVCSKHFPESSFIKGKLGRLHLKKDAVPSIFFDESTCRETSKRLLKEEFLFRTENYCNSTENDSLQSVGEESDSSSLLRKSKSFVRYSPVKELQSSIKAKITYEAVCNKIVEQEKTISALKRQNKELKNNLTYVKSLIQTLEEKKFLTESVALILKSHISS